LAPDAISAIAVLDAAIAMDRSMTRKLTKMLSAAGLVALMSGPLLIRAQTLPPTTNPVADAQDSMVLARQGLMEGIYQYMEDAEDWTEQSPSANDTAMLRALTREAAHMALVLPALQQLFPPSTNPASPEFVSRFDSYALPVIWTEPDSFAAKLDDTISRLDGILKGVEEGKGTLGQLVQNRALYDHADQTLDQAQMLVKGMREDPKKYLVIRLKLF